MFDENNDKLSLFCNVSIGQDLTYDEICNLYEMVVLAYGANKPRKLNLPNEKAINSLSGSDFVSWYNGQNVNQNNVPLLDGTDAVFIYLTII
jgi:adrenodoxin-NADP+ reductase